MASQRYYALPSGDVTQDIDYYLDKWRYLGEQVGNLIGMELSGFDPDFAFSKGMRYTRMSVSAAMSIVEQHNALKAQLDQMRDVLVVVQDQLNTFEESLPADFDKRVVQWVNDTITGNPPNLRK